MSNVYFPSFDFSRRPSDRFCDECHSLAAKATKAFESQPGIQKYITLIGLDMSPERRLFSLIRNPGFREAQKDPAQRQQLFNTLAGVLIDERIRYVMEWVEQYKGANDRVTAESMDRFPVLDVREKFGVMYDFITEKPYPLGVSQALSFSSQAYELIVEKDRAIRNGGGEVTPLFRFGEQRGHSIR